jgi:hypothetical protein
LAATVTWNCPGPLPFDPATVIHGTLLAAAHVHPAAVAI